MKNDELLKIVKEIKQQPNDNIAVNFLHRIRNQGFHEGFEFAQKLTGQRYYEAYAMRKVTIEGTIVPFRHAVRDYETKVLLGYTDTLGFIEADVNHKWLDTPEKVEVLGR